MTTTKEKGRNSGKSATQTTSTNVNALVHLSQGIPVTDSLTIAREFGRSHGHTLRKIDELIADGTLDQSNFGLIYYTDGANRQQRMIELDERGALVAMPFIGGRKSRQGQAKLVDAFLALRDAKIKAVEARASIENGIARRDAATGYRTVSMTLEMCRAETGKATTRNHYANEARLINYALTGRFTSLNRDALTLQELCNLARLEVRDAALIAMGKSYDDRKSELARYATSLNAPRLQATRHQAVAVCTTTSQ